MPWRCLENNSWRRLQDVLETKKKCLLGIFVSNISKCVSNKSIYNKSISDESKANVKCINRAILIFV